MITSSASVIRVNVRHQGIPTPSACQHCPWEQGSHGMTTEGNAGLHYYVAPTAEQRKERMFARAAARKSEADLNRQYPNQDRIQVEVTYISDAEEKVIRKEAELYAFCTPTMIDMVDFMWDEEENAGTAVFNVAGVKPKQAVSDVFQFYTPEQNFPSGFVGPIAAS